MSVGIRLKEERNRLGLTQQQMAEASGVSLRTQVGYEANQVGATAAYLASIHTIGADVVYLLTGKRTLLPAEETQLLAAWRKASRVKRSAALNALTAKAATGDTPRTSFPNASIGQQISGNVDLRGQKIVVKAPKGTPKAAR